MPRIGRPPLTEAVVRERIGAYCSRYDAQLNAEGFPAYPSGRRETPQHREWVDQFRAWWHDGISMWRRRNNDQATLRFLCELGPPPYAMTDANQAELSDRWLEALEIRAWVEQIWSAPG